MLKSNASRGVLVILLSIAAFEIGITGKFGKIWSLAFVGDPSKKKKPAAPSGIPSLPGLPPFPQGPVPA